MIADYLSDPSLYKQCMNLLDACFPGIKALADKGTSHNASWDKSSIPLIIRHENQIIAHLGLWPLKITLNGKLYRAAAIHGVCTKAEFRKKGYFRQLMLEALSLTKQDYDFTFLFTDQPYLYEPFGFKVVREYDFIYPLTVQVKVKTDIRKLDLNQLEDLGRLQDLYFYRLPLSQAINLEQETTIATLHALHEPVAYLESLDVLLVYAIKNKVLFIKDIVSKKPCDLEVILSMIPSEFTKVILQFIPDKFLTPPFTATPAVPECSLMLCSEFDFGGDYFRYPEPQRC